MPDRIPFYGAYNSNGDLSALIEFVAGDTINASSLNSALSALSDVSSTLFPSTGDNLVWNGTKWTASADGGSGGASYLSALLDASNIEISCEGASLMFVDNYWQPSGPAQVTSTEPSCGYVGQLWYDINQQSLDLLQSLSGTLVTDNYGIGAGERILYVSAGLTDIIVSGVTASSYGNRLIDIHKIDSTLNKVIVSGIGSTIGGDASVELDFEGDSATLHSFQDNWYIL